MSEINRILFAKIILSSFIANFCAASNRLHHTLKMPSVEKIEERLAERKCGGLLDKNCLESFANKRLKTFDICVRIDQELDHLILKKYSNGGVKVPEYLRQSNRLPFYYAFLADHIYLNDACLQYLGYKSEKTKDNQIKIEVDAQ